MIARLAGVVLAAVILFVLLLFGVLSSAAGNRLIVDFIEEQLAPALTVQGIAGSLLGTLCAAEVRYETEGLSVLVQDVCVDPELWLSVDFLKVHLTSLRAAAVRIETRESDTSAEPSEPTLPLPIVADALSVGHLTVNALSLERIDASVALSNEDYGVLGSFSYEDIAVSIDTAGPLSAFRVAASALDTDVRVEVDLLSDRLPYTLAATVSELDLARFVDRGVIIRGASLDAAGDLTGYDYRVTGHVQDPAAQGDLQAEGSGDWQSIRFATLKLNDLTLPGRSDIAVSTLTGTGGIRWSEAFSAVFEDLSAAGDVAGQSLQADARRVLISSTDVAIESGSADLAGGGRLGVEGRFDFDGRVNGLLEGSELPLALVREDLGGSLTLRMDLAGTADNPRFEGSAQARALTLGEQSIGDLRLEFSGTPGSGQVHLDLDAGASELKSAFRYELSGETVRLTVDEAEAGYPELEATARLENPVAVILDAGSVRVDDACLVLQSGQIEAEPGRLCGALVYPDGGLKVTLDTWDMPDLPLPNSSASVTGRVEAEVNVVSFSPAQGEATVTFSDLVASHPDLDPLRLGGLEMRADLADDRATAVLATPEVASQELRLTGTVTSVLAPIPENATLAGSLNLELNGIWVAEGLLPMDVTYELDRIRGVMTVTADLAGTVGEPVINGRLNLEGAGWDVLAVNARVSDLNLQATLSDTRTLAFESTAAVGEGSLAFHGGLEGLDTDTPVLTTEVSLARAELVNLPDYEAEVDGTISLRMGTEDLRVTGQVSLPRASILIADLPETAVSASGDEIIVDEESLATTQQVRTTDVTLTLGDEVFLEAFGLRSRLSGSLRLRESPGRLQSVTGAINLREAEFEAYGQLFRVERGQLTFAGPIDNPSVDVVATRVVTYEERDYRISLLLSGTAKNLETRVVSQPALSEEDALALLITGRTFSEITSNEQRSNVSGAALSMGLLNATGVTQNLATRLNLEEIILDQDMEGNMEVGAAVRLNRNLYLRYTYGVFSRLGGVLLRYRFSTRISVQAKTGDAHSIELRYGVDE